MRAPASPSPWGRSLPSALLLMAPFDLLASLGMDLYLPAVATMPAALGTRAGMVQLSLTVYMLAIGAGQLLFGPLSDRHGRRPVLLGGSALFAATSFALALATDGHWLVAGRLLQGLGAAAMLVATFATVRDVYGGTPQAASVYGLFSAMLAFVPAFGPLLGALVMSGLGWRALFALLGALAALASVRALRGWPETRPRRAGPDAAPARGAFGQVLADRAFRAYTLAFAAAMGTFFVFFSTAPRILMGRAGMDELGFSLVFASVALVMIAAARLLRRRIARWGVRRAARRGLGIMLAGTALLAACAMGAAPSPATVVVPMWAVAAGIVVTVSVAAEGALRAFEASAGAAVALYYCLQGLCAGVVGTALVLWLSGDSVWPVVAYCMLTSTAALLALHRLPGE